MARCGILGFRQRHLLALFLCVCATTFIMVEFKDLNLVCSEMVTEVPRSEKRFSIHQEPVNNQSLSISSSVFEPKWTYQYTSSLCKGDLDPNMAEDLFCKKRPDFLPNYKNPCWLRKDDYGQKQVTCMPFFHLLGADKCGSTDLFDRILQHPEMEPPYCWFQKECNYWCWRRYGLWMKNTTTGMRDTFDFYLRMFNAPSRGIYLQETNGYHSHITGEGTPMDLWDFRGWTRIPQNKGLKEPVIMTPHLMKHMYPNPKLLVILRNPTDRLYSDYCFLNYGCTPEQFHEEALEAVSLIQKCLKENSTKQCIFDMDMFSKLPIRIHISMYSVMLKEWLAVFPRECFLVLRNEDYGHDIKNHLHMVFDFLTLSPLPEKDLDIISKAKRKHVTESKKRKGPMLDATRVLLDKFFEPYNIDLAALLNNDHFLWKDKKTN